MVWPAGDRSRGSIVAAKNGTRGVTVEARSVADEDIVRLRGRGVEARVLRVWFLGEAVAAFIHQAMVVQRACLVLVHDVQDHLRERSVHQLHVLVR